MTEILSDLPPGSHFGPFVVRDRAELALRLAVMVGCHGHLERAIVGAYADTLGVDQRALLQAFVRTTSRDRRFELFCARVAEKLPHHLERLCEIATKAKEVSARRDDLVHHVWGLAPGFPDALLWVNGDAFEGLMLYSWGGETFVPTRTRTSTEIRLYRQSDFDELIEQTYSVSVEFLGFGQGAFRELRLGS